MKLNFRPLIKTSILSAGALFLCSPTARPDVVSVGKATYSDTFPGVDEANRNATPRVDPYVSGRAATRPVPTNDWWSNELANSHASAIFNYPLALRPVDSGLVIINNLIGQGITADVPLTVGVEGVSSKQTTVCDYTDWTVTINWHSDTGDMNATIGLGMPMVYFTKTSPDPVSINLTMGNATIDGNIVKVDGSYNRGSYLIFAPSGSSWRKEGTRLISDLGGKDYWTVMMLPGGTNAADAADTYTPYAFVFPKDTRTEWNYNAESGEVKTRYIVTPDIKEGAADKVLLGVLPHQQAHFYGPIPEYEPHSYSTARGTLHLIAGNEFETSLHFNGVLPYLPTVTGDTGFSLEELKRLVTAVCDDNGFADWTDSYNDGQLINRLVQTAEAAKASGDEEGFSRAFNLVKTQLERWMTFTPGDIAFMFYYHEPWNTMLGYPAGHGQDSNINDHNFHWGYFIRAAAMIVQYEPQWAEEWGGMINLLVRDVASSDREDPMFPYLRSFSPYAGHCWANGTASLSLGNDQESTSEAMQFNTALILWADVTGNTELRDLAVYLYTTELSAIQEYWFDVRECNLDPSFTSALASRVFGNAYDDQNFWGGGIAGSYGIQIYPVHAGSYYLTADPEYAVKLWQAMSSETKILNNDSDPNIWYDTWLRFLAMTDPDEALRLYGACTHLGEKFGESQAHTYQWLHTSAAVGTPRMTESADHPLAMSFEKDGIITYVAFNNTSFPLPVKFSDGFSMTVAPNSMGVEKAGESNPRITLTTPACSIETGNLLQLCCNIMIPEESGLEVVKVEYLIDNNVIATAPSAPYTAEWIPEQTGTFSLTARLTVNDGSTYSSRPVSIKVKAIGEPDILTCTIEDTEATEGSFKAPYTVKCETKGGNSVEISVKFAGSYVGFVGPWLFDETNGFKEIMMNDQGGGLYATTLSGLKEGDMISFRIKIAYAGGLGVTRQIQYEVGSWCDEGGGAGVQEAPVVEVSVWPNPATDVWHLLCEEKAGEATLFSLDGRIIDRAKISGGRADIDARALSSGHYILSVFTPAGVNTLRLVK